MHLSVPPSYSVVSVTRQCSTCVGRRSARTSCKYITVPLFSRRQVSHHSRLVYTQTSFSTTLSCPHASTQELSCQHGEFSASAQRSRAFTQAIFRWPRSMAIPDVLRSCIDGRCHWLWKLATIPISGVQQQRHPVVHPIRDGHLPSCNSNSHLGNLYRSVM